MGKKWVIGDVHGCAKTLQGLVEEKIQLSKDDELFLLGDYVDRGPDSKGVIDYLMGLNLWGYKMRCLKGNHEDMFLTTYKDPSEKNVWYYNGGLNTLHSFGVRDIRDVPSQYMEFLKTLESCIEVDQFVLVHAGLNFKKDDPFSDKQAMLWIRNGAIRPEKIQYRKIVHGHTPAPLTAIKEQVSKEDSVSINLDNGCVFYDVKDMGNLCALELGEMRLETQSNLDIF